MGTARKRGGLKGGQVTRLDEVSNVYREVWFVAKVSHETEGFNAIGRFDADALPMLFCVLC